MEYLFENEDGKEKSSSFNGKRLIPDKMKMPDVSKMLFIKYKNLSRRSGVAEYSLIPFGIVIRFKSGGAYFYSTDSDTGPNLIKMRLLAKRGLGLNRFLNKRLKKSVK